MIKKLILGVILLFSANSINAESELFMLDNTPCRVTVTISIPDGLGGIIGVSATAGNIFTSCSTARSRALRKIRMTTIHMME